MTEWTLGQCANCDAPLDPDEPASLYCSERCKEYAKHVRYFRACYVDGRSDDPEVKEALGIRLAHLVVGGYNAKERQIQPSLRIEVLAANGGMCCMCNSQPATEVDHIKGPSGERGNLQRLCRDCHIKKTKQHTIAMTAEHKKARDVFLLRVFDDPPERACDDERTWTQQWPVMLAETREWRKLELGNVEAGYFGDGSTGTIDDYEHGVYLQMLAERDD